MAKRLENGMVKVYDKTGVAIEVHPIDARELVKSGEYFGRNPLFDKPRNVQKNKPKINTVGEEDDITYVSSEDYGNPHNDDEGGFNAHTYEDNVDLKTLGKTELLEFSEEKFKVKLNNRFGELRLREEIKKLKEKHWKKDEEEEISDEGNVIDRDENL